MKTTGTIFVKNMVQLNLLKCELLGQMSDGLWENSRNQSWKFLGNIQISENARIEFERWIPYDYKGYNVNSKELIDIIGARMLAFCRITFLTNSEITTYVQYFLESISNIKEDETLTSIERFNEKLEYYKKSSVNSDYYTRSYNEINAFIELYGAENIVNALNCTNYKIKDMRKDLREITTALKNKTVKEING